MTIRHICSWQYQSTSRGRWASKRLLMEFVSHLGKKLLFAWTAWLDSQDPQRNDCWTCLKVRWSFGVSTSWKNLPDTFRTQNKVTGKLPIYVELSLKFPALWKSLMDTMGQISGTSSYNFLYHSWINISTLQIRSISKIIKAQRCIIYFISQNLKEYYNFPSMWEMNWSSGGNYCLLGYTNMQDNFKMNFEDLWIQYF